MSSTVAYRVMDRGEHQKVHPFFGNFVKTGKAKDPASSPPVHENSADQSVIPTPVSVPDSLQLYKGPSTPDSTLEEDPNVQRRKRVKTSMPKAEPHNVEAQESNPLQTEKSVFPPANQESQNEESTPPRKPLKLNTNGKLLSSPPAHTSENVADVKSRDRRKSNWKGTGTKKVIIKYEKQSNTGEQINNIINGKERYTAPQKSVATVPAATKKDSKCPPKATHPFFLLKKPAVSPLVENLQPTTESLDQPDSVKINSDIPSSAKITTSRSLFTKQAEPAPPLWPPKDLVHVRGSVHELCGKFEGMSLSQKKSKQRAVNIDDAENILLYESEKAQREMRFQSSDTGQPFLRVPIRSIISGHTLRKTMKSKFLHCIESRSKHVSGYQGEEGRAHPSIAKLYASIETSTTSFDNGLCETIQWTQKYSPKCAEDVLQSGPEARMLRDWLKELMVTSVGTGNTPTNTNKKNKSRGHKSKRRKVADKLDGFIVSSEDEASEMDELEDSEEDELAGGVTVSSKRTVIRVGDSVGKFKAGDKGRLTNAVLISGPHGCGKSASVYAVAKELDFEVFEINSGTRRSAKDILERVGDMTQNHLVRLDGKGSQSGTNDHATEHEFAVAKQNAVNMFFKKAVKNKSKDNRSKTKGKIDESTDPRKAPIISSRSQKQSLILLEEVDVLFEEDKQFWTGILTLIEQSKRPIIMTCTNEALVPLPDLSLHAILRYRAPPSSLAIDYLLLVAANEGHMLSRESVSSLYSTTQYDLRKSIMQLDFWCQMAVGSQKSGIDWILDRWPAGSDVDPNGNKLKVISLHTYQRCMGWFNRDLSLVDRSLTKDSALLLEGLNWWELDFDTDDDEDGWWSTYLSQSWKHQRHIDSLQDVMIMAECHSAFDVLSRGWSLEQNKDDLDTTIITISEKEKANYLEDYPLLVANRKPDYTGLSSDIGSTAYALMRRIVLNANSLQDDYLANNRVLSRHSETKPSSFSSAAYYDAFEPIARATDSFAQTTGRLAPSFENGVSVISTDIAPYIRSIMAYDLRLERYRDELSGASSQGSTKRKARTTRASRAALEGGSKSQTRRERWFPTEANPKRIMATGLKTWEAALTQMGHLVVFPSLTSRENTQTDSEGSQSTDAEGDNMQMNSLAE